MIDIATENVLIALGVTTAAGLATALGSVLVLGAKAPNPRVLAFGLSFAGGAMVYVSLSEILNKSIWAFEKSFDPDLSFIFATLAFLGGVFLIATIDRLIPNPHETLEADGKKFKSNEQDYIKRVALMTALAITIHNFPEGLATFFATLESPEVGMPLAFAIAIHNIPEGISIAVPVYFATNNKYYAFWASMASGLAEPIGAILGYMILAPYLTDSVFAIVFGMIAGVMVFLAMDELLPAAKKYAKGHETVYGLVLGMAALALSLILFRL